MAEHNPQEEIIYRKEVVAKMKPLVEPLTRYLPWLESKKGQTASSTYGAEGIAQNSISFPVYDGTLMSFVKDVQRSGLTDRNYVYVYSRNRIRTVEDERKLIAESELKDMDRLRAVLSRYILTGQTKGYMWTEAVSNGIFFDVISRMKEVIEFWDKPM